METLDRYLAQLASTEPTPGGGSAAALVAAVGAALVAMAARISSQNPKYAAQHELALRLAAAADALRAELTAARDRDERAFARVVAAQALPRESDAEREARTRALETALGDAAAVPLRACELCMDVLRLSLQTLQIPNKNLASDLGCAAEFAVAALAACAYNVRVNHRYMRDAAAIETQSKMLARYETEAPALLANVRRDVGAALARPR
ncbi:MAG: cyclodeaminase/cyclohydrolase family protein [Candidatus Eremiobacteraeota bacterium]|nr:cyclodeaminase/cyclohydrolase family protein [Candidatus Eremiobacteraeota bacterium]